MPAPVGSHQRDGLARLHVQADVPQHRRFRRVAEADALVLDPARHRRQGNRGRRCRDVRRDVQELEYPVGGHQGAGELSELARQVANGFEEAVYVEREGDEQPHLQGRPDHPASNVDDYGRRDDSQQLDRRPQAVPVAGGPQGCVQVIPVDRAEGTGVVPLPVEALHDADSRDVLLDAGVHAGDGHSGPPQVRLGKPAPEHQARDQQRDHAQGNRRKSGVHEKHRYGDSHHAEQVRQRECEDGEQCLAQLHRVVLDSRHDPARLVPVVEGHRQGLYVLEEPGADVQDQALADVHEQTAVDHARGEPQQRHHRSAVCQHGRES